MIHPSPYTPEQIENLLDKVRGHLRCWSGECSWIPNDILRALTAIIEQLRTENTRLTHDLKRRETEMRICHAEKVQICEELEQHRKVVIRQMMAAGYPDTVIDRFEEKGFPDA